MKSINQTSHCFSSSSSTSPENKYEHHNQHHQEQLKESIERTNSLSKQSNCQAIESQYKNKKDLMKKPSVGSKVEKGYIEERIMQNKSSKSVRPNCNVFSKEEIELRRSETKFGSKPTLDILLGRYTPKIINALVFTRSGLPMNKVFVKNKYAHLF